MGNGRAASHRPSEPIIRTPQLPRGRSILALINCGIRCVVLLGSPCCCSPLSIFGPQPTSLAPLPLTFPSIGAAAYISNVTGSDLGAATATENVMLHTTQPELMSGVLSTADMEVLLAQGQQGQGQEQGPE